MQDIVDEYLISDFTLCFDRPAFIAVELGLKLMTMRALHAGVAFSNGYRPVLGTVHRRAHSGLDPYV